MIHLEAINQPIKPEDVEQDEAKIKFLAEKFGLKATNLGPVPVVLKVRNPRPKRVKKASARYLTTRPKRCEEDFCAEVAVLQPKA